MDKQQGPIVYHRNCSHYPIINHNRKEYKKNESVPFAKTWVYLEIIIVSEVNQTERDKYRMLSLIF